MTMALTQIAIIGANGSLGPSILSALLSVPSFKVTVLSRAKSTSTYPSSVTVQTIPDNPSESDYASALTAQDALLTTFGGTNAELQITLANAAASAGVKLFIPADFGSCDSSSQFALDLMPLYVGKKKVRDHLQSLAAEGKLSWTSIVCGHFFDYGLKCGLLLADLKTNRATVFDGGDIKFSCSTLAQVGKAVVKILRNPEQVRNKMIYVQSFSITQNELVGVLEKVTGRKWETEDVRSEDFIKKSKAAVEENPKDSEARENLVGVVGIIDGDWTGMTDFANKLLGLQEGDLEAAVRKVVDDKA
jgi:NmrA-like family